MNYTRYFTRAASVTGNVTDKVVQRDQAFVRRYSGEKEGSSGLFGPRMGTFHAGQAVSGYTIKDRSMQQRRTNQYPDITESPAGNL